MWSPGNKKKLVFAIATILIALGVFGWFSFQKYLRQTVLKAIPKTLKYRQMQIKILTQKIVFRGVNYRLCDGIDLKSKSLIVKLGLKKQIAKIVTIRNGSISIREICEIQGSGASKETVYFISNSNIDYQGKYHFNKVSFKGFYDQSVFVAKGDAHGQYGGTIHFEVNDATDTRFKVNYNLDNVKRLYAIRGFSLPKYKITSGRVKANISGVITKKTLSIKNQIRVKKLRAVFIQPDNLIERLSPTNFEYLPMILNKAGDLLIDFHVKTDRNSRLSLASIYSSRIKAILKNRVVSQMGLLKKLIP